MFQEDDNKSLKEYRALETTLHRDLINCCRRYVNELGIISIIGIMDIVKRPETDEDPFGSMLKILIRLSEIFSFRSMISIIPELVALAMKYGMMVEKAYEEDATNIEEDIQGFDSEDGQQKRIDKIQKDLDKLNLYL